MIKSHVLTISILICGLAQTAYLHENSGEIFGAVDGQEANFRCVKVGNAAVDGWNIQSVNEGGGGASFRTFNGIGPRRKQAPHSL